MQTLFTLFHGWSITESRSLSSCRFIQRTQPWLASHAFPYVGEPQHPLSVLGAATRANRQQSVAIFKLAIGEERLAEDIRTVLPVALWALSMGFLLYFIYDDSPNQERTYKLVDGALELLVRFLSLVKSPLLKPFRGSLFALLGDTGLLAEPTPPAPHSPQEERP